MELSIAITLTGQLETGRMYFRLSAPVSLEHVSHPAVGSLIYDRTKEVGQRQPVRHTVF